MSLKIGKYSLNEMFSKRMYHIMKKWYKNTCGKTLSVAECQHLIDNMKLFVDWLEIHFASFDCNEQFFILTVLYFSYLHEYSNKNNIQFNQYFNPKEFFTYKELASIKKTFDTHLLKK